MLERFLVPFEFEFGREISTLALTTLSVCACIFIFWKMPKNTHKIPVYRKFCIYSWQEVVLSSISDGFVECTQVASEVQIQSAKEDCSH